MNYLVKKAVPAPATFDFTKAQTGAMRVKPYVNWVAVPFGQPAWYAFGD